MRARYGRFLERWSKNRESDDDLNRLDSEEQGIFETIRFGREAGITMAGVRIGGTLEAFSMGTMNQERNMTVTHVEKANLELRGLYNYLEKNFNARLSGGGICKPGRRYGT